MVSDLRASAAGSRDSVKSVRKYVGYKEFAKFVSSSDDFFAVRRFDRVHCRLLLRLQDQISELEEQLDLLDSKLSDRECEDVDNGTVRSDRKEREDILNSLYAAVGKYGRFSPFIRFCGASKLTNSRRLSLPIPAAQGRAKGTRPDNP